MRIGCAYHPREHVGCGKFHFIADAFRALGHDVYHLQTMDDVKRADQACDFILFEQRGPASLCIPDLVELSRDRQSVWMQQYFDLNVFDDAVPLQKQAPIEPFLEIMRAMDVVFVKEKDRLLDYRDIGVNARWLDQGCPSTMRQANLRENPEFDVILWGSSSRPMWKQRWQDVEHLVRSGFEVAWATSDGTLPAGVIRLPGCQPMEIPNLVEKASVTLVVDARSDIKGYWSDRIWLAAGAGACIVRRAGVSGGCLPGIGYFTGNSLLSLVADLCENYAERKSRGEESRKFTMARHTYENRCQEVIRHAQSVLDKRPEEPSLSEVHWDGEDCRQNQSREENAASVSLLQ